MSWQATAYVVELRRCPDGAPLNRGQKMLLLIMANHHNPSLRYAFPGVPTLADEAMCSIPQVKRDLKYLEQHGVIWKLAGKGAGHFTRYGYRALDGEPPAVDEKGTPVNPLSRVTKGSSTTPFCPERKGSETVQNLGKKGSERVHGAQRNKEEPLSPKAITESACGAIDSHRLLLSGIASDGVAVSMESWTRLLGELLKRVDPHSFDTWLRPTRALAIGDAVLVVSVPTRDWLLMVAKFAREIEQAVRECGLACKQIDFVAGCE